MVPNVPPGLFPGPFRRLDPHERSMPRYLSLLILIVGLGGPARAAAPATPVSARVGPPASSSVGPAGVDSARIDASLAEALRVWNTPGLAVAIVHHDEVVYLRGLGVRRVGSKEPV